MAMDCIVPGLFLGGLDAARNSQLLHSKKISHILTVNTKDIGPSRQEGFEHLFLEANDDMEEDLLRHFPAAFDFMDRGIQAGGVLVHCFFGVSRSATLVTAFLMQRHKLSLKGALAFVKQKRSIISPNPNFMNQLKLFEKMNNRLDHDHVLFKNFRLYHTARNVREAGSPADAQQNIAFQPDPSPSSAPGDPVYRCGKCRRTLFREQARMKHCKPQEDCEEKDEEDEEDEEEAAEDWCMRELFIEPVEWMRSSILGKMDGKLYCPKCKAKVGSFTWLGERCTCQNWICPAFHMRAQAIDRMVTKAPNTS